MVINVRDITSSHSVHKSLESIAVAWIFFLISFHLFYICIVTYVTLDLSNYILQNYNIYRKSQTVTVIK